MIMHTHKLEIYEKLKIDIIISISYINDAFLSILNLIQWIFQYILTIEKFYNENRF